MDYKNILADIKAGNFEKIYFLHGEEAFYIDEITDAIVQNALEESERDFNQSIFYGKESDALNIISEAKGYPMMAQRRLVILKEAQYFKQFDLLIPYFETPAEQTVFVVNYKHGKYDSRKKEIKAAAKNGVVFKSDKIREYNLVNSIDEFAKSRGYGITPKASMLLAEFLGSDLGKIANELNKLEILLDQGTTINEIHIEENIGISKDYNVFELVNAIALRDITKANRIVDYFNNNPKATSIIFVISSLFNHFSRLMKIHFLKNKSKDSVASEMRVPPFVAGQLMSSAKIYNPKKIASNIAALHEYDLKSKGINNSSFTDGELMKELVYQLMN